MVPNITKADIKKTVEDKASTITCSLNEIPDLILDVHVSALVSKKSAYVEMFLQDSSVKC